MKVEVATHFPRHCSWYANAFDELQFWLIDRSVCMRHQEHKAFWQYQKVRLPSRELGLTLPNDDYPVFTYPCVGVVSWALPKINIIDQLGLNDYVIARNPVVLSRNVNIANPQGIHQIAHNRRSPDGYIKSFKPNVLWLPEAGKIVIEKREEPLTEEDIRECERKWAQWVKRKRNAL